MPNISMNKQIRHLVDAADVIVEDLRAVQRGRVRVQVDKIENAERHDARQLVQLAQKKRIAESDQPLT